MTPTDTQVGDQWGELERLAKTATPGPWTNIEGANNHVFDLRVTAVKDQYNCVAFSDGEDAAFIAAANPAAVLELIAAARSVGTKSEGRSGPQEDGLSITHSEPDHPIRGERELLPCPFCGGRAVERIGMGETWICCNFCGASTALSGADEQAIAAWNRRAHPPTTYEGEGLRNAVNSAVIRWVYSGEQDLGPRVMTGCNFSLLTDAILQALPTPEAPAWGGAYNEMWGNGKRVFGPTPPPAHDYSKAVRVKPTPGGEGLRDKLARAVAKELARQDRMPEWQPAEDWDMTWDYIDQGEVDFGLIADSILQALQSAGEK